MFNAKRKSNENFTPIRRCINDVFPGELKDHSTYTVDLRVLMFGLFPSRSGPIGTISKQDREEYRNSSTVAACKIQQGESRQVCTVSHVFRSNSRYTRPPRVCGSFFLPDYYSLFRYFLPSRYFVHNLFRSLPFLSPPYSVNLALSHK